MGCDIHMYVEYRPKSQVGRNWLCGDIFHTIDPLRVPSLKHMDLHGERNYDLFAVLADVRNYDNVEYIEDPRGIPNDCTEYVALEYERWDIDAHSASWFTLRELIEFKVEHDPRDRFGRDILKPLIDKLKKRADELDLIWDFEWGRENTAKVALERAENIRIVFWFDN